MESTARSVTVKGDDKDFFIWHTQSPTVGHSPNLVSDLSESKFLDSREQLTPWEASWCVTNKIAYFWGQNGPNPCANLHFF